MDWRHELARYLEGRLPAATSVEIETAGYMAAGASNETIPINARVTCDGYPVVLPLVLRPQRVEGILAPYNVERQFRIMRAMATSEVPVPGVAWYEPSPEVLGTPFYVMTRVRGETLPLFWYGSASPRLPVVAEMLVRIHQVPWRERLGFLHDGDEATTPLESDLGPWR